MSRPHEPPAPEARAPGETDPRRRRWPLALGVAVSLALAAAIAWQAWPGPGDGRPAAGKTPAPAAVDAMPSPALDASATVDEEGLDDEPPATVDSPQARRAWLERIRELRDAGELEAARASLGEYRRRYPGLDLPRDLEGMLSE